MAVFLKKVRRELEKGKRKAGSHVPPSYVWRNTSSYAELPVKKLNKIMRPGVKSIDFTGIVKSENIWTGTEPNYKVTVRFTDVKFSKKELKSFPNKEIVNGKEIFFKSPTFDKNPVQMKCQCTDFRHKFETPLSEFGGIIGGPRKYKRLTPPWTFEGVGGRPYANHADGDGSAKIKIKTGDGKNAGAGPSVTMNSKLGYCKHIHSMLVHLKEEGLVSETTRIK